MEFMLSWGTINRRRLPDTAWCSEESLPYESQACRGLKWLLYFHFNNFIIFPFEIKEMTETRLLLDFYTSLHNLIFFFSFFRVSPSSICTFDEQELSQNRDFEKSFEEKKYKQAQWGEKKRQMCKNEKIWAHHQI